MGLSPRLHLHSYEFYYRNNEICKMNSQSLCFQVRFRETKSVQLYFVDDIKSDPL